MKLLLNRKRKSTVNGANKWIKKLIPALHDEGVINKYCFKNVILRR